MCILSCVPGAVGGAGAVLGEAGALVLLAHVQLVQGSAPSGARFNALEKHHENHWSIEQHTCSILKCSIVQSDWCSVGSLFKIQMFNNDMVNCQIVQFGNWKIYFMGKVQWLARVIVNSRGQPCRWVACLDLGMKEGKPTRNQFWICRSRAQMSARRIVVQ